MADNGGAAAGLLCHASHRRRVDAFTLDQPARDVEYLLAPLVVVDLTGHSEAFASLKYRSVETVECVQIVDGVADPLDDLDGGLAGLHFGHVGCRRQRDGPEG